MAQAVATEEVTTSARSAALERLPTEITYLPPQVLRPNPKNPRGAVAPGDPALLELVEAIRENGQSQPALVRPVHGLLDKVNGPAEFEIVIGHRRAKACELLGREIACLVAELTDDQALAIMLSDNEVQAEVDPLKEADAIAALVDALGSVAAVSKALGKSRSWVARRANLRNLSKKVRERLTRRGSKAGQPPGAPVWEWTLDMLERLAQLAPDAQDTFVERTHWVRLPDQLDSELAKSMQLLGLAPWKLEDETLVAAAGSCAKCPKTSARQPELFPDDADAAKPGSLAKARCLDAVCFQKKKDAHALIQIKAAQKEHPKALFVEGTGAYDGRAKPEGFKGKVLGSWEVQPAAKSDPKAVPAIVVSGDKVGEVKYVLPPGAPREYKTPEQKKAEKTKNLPPEKRAAAERAALEERRRAHVVEAFKKVVEKLKAPPADTIAELGAVYGLDDVGDYLNPKYAKALGVADVDAPEGVIRRKAYEKIAASDRAFEEAVWPIVRDRISGLYGQPSELYDEFAWLADEKILDIDLAKLEAEAKKKIPDPAWLKKAEEKAGASPAPAKETAPPKLDRKRQSAGERDDLEEEDLRGVEAEDAESHSVPLAPLLKKAKKAGAKKGAKR